MHGKVETYPVSAWWTLARWAIIFGLLYWGGFFR